LCPARLPARYVLAAPKHDTGGLRAIFRDGFRPDGDRNRERVARTAPYHPPLSLPDAGRAIRGYSRLWGARQPRDGRAARCRTDWRLARRAGGGGGRTAGDAVARAARAGDHLDDAPLFTDPHAQCTRLGRSEACITRRDHDTTVPASDDRTGA